MQQRTRSGLVGVAALSTLTAMAVVGPVPAQAAPATTTGYDRCPWGKVCAFEGWDGTGAIWVAPGCKNNDVPVWMQNLGVSSVKTHGNAATLTIKRPYTLGYVRPWTGTNLSPTENDLVSAVFVHC